MITHVTKKILDKINTNPKYVPRCMFEYNGFKLDSQLNSSQTDVYAYR